MLWVEKRMGIINATFFRGEVTEIVTIHLTTDGRFNLISTDKVEFTEAMAFVDYIAEIHRAGNYDAFMIGSYGVNKGIIDAMRDRGLPVISMEDMFEAIDGMVGGDLIKLEPGTPECLGFLKGMWGLQRGLNRVPLLHGVPPRPKRRES